MYKIKTCRPSFTVLYLYINFVCNVTLLCCVFDVVLSPQELSHRLKELMEHSSVVSSEKRQFQEECQQLIQQRTKLELDIKDLQTSVTEDATSKVI